MVIDILRNKGAACDAVHDLIISRGHAVAGDTYISVDLAVAPLLTVKIPDAELQHPHLGTYSTFHHYPTDAGRRQFAGHTDAKNR